MRTNTQEAVLSAYIASIGKRTPRDAGQDVCHPSVVSFWKLGRLAVIVAFSQYDAAIGPYLAHEFEYTLPPGPSKSVTVGSHTQTCQSLEKNSMLKISGPVNSLPMRPAYFSTSVDLRAWLTKNHARCTELIVGFHKKGSGTPSITYSEALDQALCFGWIDGVRKSVDAARYTIRFTPRKARSYWSAGNTRRANQLIKRSMMQPPGLKAFQARDRTSSKRYSFERQHAKFPCAYSKQFRSHPYAWAFFQSQPPYYKRVATWWVISAKQEETRFRRLQTLIDVSSQNRRIPQFLSGKKSAS